MDCTAFSGSLPKLCFSQEFAVSMAMNLRIYMAVPRIHLVPNVELNGFISIKSTKRVLFRGMVSISKVSYHLQNVSLPWWLSGKEFACQCRRHGFDSLVWKDPTCQDAAKLVHNYCAGALKPRNHNYWSPSLDPCSTTRGITMRSPWTQLE